MAVDRPMFSIFRSEESRFGGGEIKEVFLKLYLPTTRKIMKYFNKGKAWNVFTFLMCWMDGNQSNIFPSVSTIAEGIGASDVETVYRALDYLETLAINGSRVLIKVNRGKNDKGQYLSNMYTLWPTAEQVPEYEWQRTDIMNIEVDFDAPKAGPSRMTGEIVEDVVRDTGRQNADREIETVPAKTGYGPYRQNAGTKKNQLHEEESCEASQAQLPVFSDNTESKPKYQGKGTIEEPYLVRDKKLVVASQLPEEAKQQLEISTHIKVERARRVLRNESVAAYYKGLVGQLVACKSAGLTLVDRPPLGEGAAKTLTAQGILTDYLVTVYECSPDYARMGRILKSVKDKLWIVLKSIEDSTKVDIVGNVYDWVQGAVANKARQNNIQLVKPEAKVQQKDKTRVEALKKRVQDFGIINTDYAYELEQTQKKLDFYDRTDRWVLEGERSRTVEIIDTLKELVGLLDRKQVA